MVEPHQTADPQHNGTVARPLPADELDQSQLLTVLSDVENGDFGVRMPLEWTGVAGKIAATLNNVIAANQTLGAELAQGQPRRRQGRQALPARRAAGLGPGLV